MASINANLKGCFVLSQFFARYMRDNHLSAKAVKDKLRKKGGADEFRKFLQGDLGAELFGILADTKTSGNTLSAALYELDDDLLEEAIIALPNQMKLILANGSATPDGNKSARDNLNGNDFPTIDRLLGSKGLGHNKFLVRADAAGTQAVWTGSTTGRRPVSAPRSIMACWWQMLGWRRSTKSNGTVWRKLRRRQPSQLLLRLGFWRPTISRRILRCRALMSPSGLPRPPTGAICKRSPI